MGSFNNARAQGVRGKAGSVATVAGIMGDMRGGVTPKSAVPYKGTTGAHTRSGLYDKPTQSNFEEEIKKRKKKPAGGSSMGGDTGAGYGGSTKLG